MAKKGKIDQVGTTTTDETKDFSGLAVEGTKAADAEITEVATETPEEKTVVTGEDVLKTMRSNGVRI